MVDLKDMIFGTMGGLGLFLFGMGMMSDGLKKALVKQIKISCTVKFGISDLYVVELH